MVNWIVFYDDGRSFSSDDGSPERADPWGVICVVSRSREHGRTLWVGKDYFWWDEDAEWVCGDFAGLLDYLTRRPYAPKIVLVGRGRAATRFHDICKRALADPRLPEKTSLDWLEDTET